MNKKTFIILAIVVLVIVGGGAFYLGMNYGSSQATAAAVATRAGFANRANRGGSATGGFTTGTIISQDNTSITLQLPNNSGSKIVFYSDSTQIGKMTAGSSSDLKTGTSVSVNGTTNSDGSITAQSIQIRPNNPQKPAAQ